MKQYLNRALIEPDKVNKNGIAFTKECLQGMNTTVNVFYKERLVGSAKTYCENNILMGDFFIKDLNVNHLYPSYVIHIIDKVIDEQENKIIKKGELESFNLRTVDMLIEDYRIEELENNENN